MARLLTLFLVSVFVSFVLSAPTQDVGLNNEKTLNMVPRTSADEKPIMQTHHTAPDTVTPVGDNTGHHVLREDESDESDIKEGTDESDIEESRELISDPLLRSNIESLVAQSSVEATETLDANEFINIQPVRETLDNIVSTSDLFHFPGAPRKYRVVVLPKGKALHFVYKVIVFPKGKFAHTKIFKLIIIPSKITKLGKKVTFIVIPKDAPGSWKKYSIFIPHKS
ncbi:5346_t:CDS:2 [Scutellospora calospora]|uniref:5346_t:CDS:1 n=1 Tax=Scutellospora calospora TaxID=85575 RepID=A0ACA9M4W2_9GLOM|nr:5346_t:CDS:2 [Scutellospora calospora]